MRKVIGLSVAALLAAGAYLAQEGSGGRGMGGRARRRRVHPTAMARRPITRVRPERRRRQYRLRNRQPVHRQGRARGRRIDRHGPQQGAGRQERHRHPVQGRRHDGRRHRHGQTHQRGVPHRLLHSSDAHVPQRHEGQRPAAERNSRVRGSVRVERGAGRARRDGGDEHARTIACRSSS